MLFESIQIDKNHKTFREKKILSVLKSSEYPLPTSVKQDGYWASLVLFALTIIFTLIFDVRHLVGGPHHQLDAGFEGFEHFYQSAVATRTAFPSTGERTQENLQHQQFHFASSRGRLRKCETNEERKKKSTSVFEVVTELKNMMIDEKKKVVFTFCEMISWEIPVLLLLVPLIGCLKSNSKMLINNTKHAFLWTYLHI